MRQIPNKFSSSKETVSKCVCGQSENMEHIYKSIFWNIKHEKTFYEKIHSENISEIKKVYDNFKVSFDIRNKFLSESERR